MKVEVWDSDVLSDDLIGEGVINLTKILDRPNHIENCINIFIVRIRGFNEKRKLQR